MMNIRGLLLFATVLFVMMFTAGCEDSGITESIETDEGELFPLEQRMHELREKGTDFAGKKLGYITDPEAISFELSPEEKTLTEEQLNNAIETLEEGYPKEIEEAWKQFHADLKHFFGVDELPRTEISPGTYSRIPPEYTKEREKQEKLINFLSGKYREMIALYEKYGLREAAHKKIPSKISPMNEDFWYDANSLASAYNYGTPEIYYNFYTWTSTFPDVLVLELEGRTSGMGYPSPPLGGAFFVRELSTNSIEWFSGTDSYWPPDPGYRPNICVRINSWHSIWADVPVGYISEFSTDWACARPG